MAEAQLTMRQFNEVLGNLGPKDLVVDVREPEEFMEAHLKGARNIPLATVANHASELKKFDHVYIHCRRGGRATKAYEALKGAGLDNLVCIGDWGMEAWIDSGFPVEH